MNEGTGAGIPAVAARDPERFAVVAEPSGKTLTYAELEAQSRALAANLIAYGLSPGDHIAIIMGNRLEYLVVIWAARRAGLFFTPVNWHLSHHESRYIVEDCGARVLIMSSELAPMAEALHGDTSGVELYLMAGDAKVAGFRPLDEFLAEPPKGAASPEVEGAVMFYSSGTTGLPKGIKRQLAGNPFCTPSALEGLMQLAYAFDDSSVYLCPAPLYHAAPLAWTMGAMTLGGTVVVMERFDPLEALRLIETHRVSHTQMVPTMFVRMLKLDDDERQGHDLSSLKSVIHAAAPCPIDVKERMIEWFGPIIDEYYAGSEGMGLTDIKSQEWLTHKGSVGTAKIGIVHIMDDDGNELPTGETGVVYFESDVEFQYHNDPEKTASVFNDRGWSTLGDMGYLDEEGYLYLVDRKSHMIISGGVNIYPQEVENLLALHPAVRDIAVIGVPNEEFGEEVKAVIEPADGVDAGETLGMELIDYCRERLAHYKCPKSVDFVDALPRLPNGKMMKRELRKTYWP